MQAAGLRIQSGQGGSTFNTGTVLGPSGEYRTGTGTNPTTGTFPSTLDASARGATTNPSTTNPSTATNPTTATGGMSHGGPGATATGGMSHGGQTGLGASATHNTSHISPSTTTAAGTSHVAGSTASPATSNATGKSGPSMYQGRNGYQVTQKQYPGA